MREFSTHPLKRPVRGECLVPHGRTLRQTSTKVTPDDT